jgi:hypothetical protein
MAFFKERVVLLAIAVACLVSMPGCGYSLSGRGSFLPAYIKVIGVPAFTNATSVYDVERKMSERVRAELIGRGKYKVTSDTTGVDAVLTGEILSITLVPSGITQQVQASRYVLTLTARIEFKDTKTDKVLWSNSAMQYREEYDVTNVANAADPSAFFGQDVNALDRITQEFARSIVSAILEAF